MLSEKETKLYDPFVSSDPHCLLHLFLGLILPFQIKAISPHVLNLKVVKTSHAGDKSTNSDFPYTLKSNCLVYQANYDDKNLNMSHIEFVIKVKSGLNEDPFVDKPKEKPKSNKSKKKLKSTKELNPFLCAEGPHCMALGQLTVYATAVLSSQYCTHMFIVFIVGQYARLIRWNRGGAVVTEKIDFNSQPHLFHFFVHYNMAQPEAHGYNSTVKPLKLHEIEPAKATIPELAKANSFLAITTSNECFIIRSPNAQPDVPVGHWTHLSFAYDVNNKHRVILKDSWHVQVDNIKPEGKIYEILHANHIPNIPHFSYASDVGDDTQHQTRMDKVFEKRCISHHSCWKPITHHWHYCIVLLTVGRKLKEFKCTKEFVDAMLAALKGEMTIFLAISLPDSHLTHL